MASWPPRGPLALGPQLRSQGSCQPPATSTSAVRMIAFVKLPLRVSAAKDWSQQLGVKAREGVSSMLVQRGDGKVRLWGFFYPREVDTMFFCFCWGSSFLHCHCSLFYGLKKVPWVLGSPGKGGTHSLKSSDPEELTSLMFKDQNYCTYKYKQQQHTKYK